MITTVVTILSTLGAGSVATLLVTKWLNRKSDSVDLKGKQAAQWREEMDDAFKRINLLNDAIDELQKRVCYTNNCANRINGLHCPATSTTERAGLDS